MNDMNMQDLLSLAALVVLFVDVAAASIMKQRGKAKLAKMLLVSGIISSAALLGMAFFMFAPAP